MLIAKQKTAWVGCSTDLLGSIVNINFSKCHILAIQVLVLMGQRHTIQQVSPLCEITAHTPINNQPQIKSQRKDLSYRIVLLLCKDTLFSKLRFSYIVYKDHCCPYSHSYTIISQIISRMFNLILYSAM